ncbi:MAG TPA: 16S rRNA (guanine(966)-N(2))-methyltransferase RsmD [Vicinamibacterales bacterium]|jgi:16S rRNA (guanine966-N2)-methyltransferase
MTTFSLRVIAGSLKGRRLKAPTWEGLRPTSEKLRETLFNILAPRIAGASVLDGYAGTGALGIEAISRGAAMVTFVEADRRAQALIADNLAHCGVENGYAIVRGRIESAIENVAVSSIDLALFDPPYDTAAADVATVIAGTADLLTPGGVLILEHAKRRPSPEGAGTLVRGRQVISGDSALSFYSCPL